MSATRPVVVVVDGYVSGRHLAAELRGAGADVVHLRSSRDWLPAQAVPDLTPYADQEVFDDVDSTTERLRRRGTVAVLAGMEPGVELADLLAERLGLPGNGTALSSARRDKFAMVETVRAAGLPAARQVRGADEDRLLAWARAELEHGPVVVKPLRSAGADGVAVCEDLAAVRDHVRGLLTGRTVYDEPNVEVLLQEHLPGEEFIVDVVSGTGGRYLCGVWQYHRRFLPGGEVLLDGDELVDETADHVPAMAEYVGRVLDALHMHHGPAHAEVKMTPTGPVLVEVGSRVSGNLHPRFHDLVTGSNQGAAAAAAVLDPERFARDFAGRTYRRRRRAFCATTSTAHDGTVVAIDDTVLARLRAMPEVFHVDLKRGPGSAIRPTVDLSTSTMRVFLHGGTEERVRAARRALDAVCDDVYVVEKVAAAGGVA